MNLYSMQSGIFSAFLFMSEIFWKTFDSPAKAEL